ncbi:hypothetical protein EMIT047CA2_150117 [Pseudomonas soli]
MLRILVAPLLKISKTAFRGCFLSLDCLETRSTKQDQKSISESYKHDCTLDTLRSEKKILPCVEILELSQASFK